MSETLATGDHGGGGADFPSTHWTVVLSAAASGARQAEDAMAELCKAYWYPVYVFLRRKGHGPAESEDLTQEFLSRMVHKEMLAGLTREGGRFRSFLLTALKRFVVNEWNRQNTLKRGGGRKIISIDEAAENRYRREIVDQTTPETLFERDWALEVLGRVFGRLRQEYRAAGKAGLFGRIQNCLPGAKSQDAEGNAHLDLNMSEAAVRMAAHRLRRRYGQLLRSEIAATVSTPDEIDEEIRYLMEIMSQV